MKRFVLSLAALMAAAACAQAGDPELDKVRKALIGKLPGVTPEMITKSAAPGLYQVQHGTEYAYVTPDGRFLVHGDMIDLVTGDEVTEQQRGAARQAVLKQFGPDDVIEFAPKDPKFFVTVFTDIDCGYCRKLHSEIAKYNALGIGVRYLFYPRTGPNTPSFQQAQAVWCSTNRQDALTMAKRGVHIKAASNCANPVQRQYDAGASIGINATPTLVMPDGEVVRGYMPAQALHARLASVPKDTAAN